MSAHLPCPLRRLVRACAAALAASCVSASAAAADPAPVWAQPAELSLPADGSSSAGHDAEIDGIACTAAGDCVAVGTYATSATSPAAGGREAFVATETGGIWGQSSAVALPSDADSGSNQEAYLNSVSCTSTGNCEAVGQYRTGGEFEAMAVNESGGMWAQAVKVYAPADANSLYPDVSLNSVFCVSAGDCEAVGQYTNSANDTEAITANETSEVWSRAVELNLPNDATTTATQRADLNSVFCSDASDCEAVGDFVDTFGNQQAMVAGDTGGNWAQASDVSLPANASPPSSSNGQDALLSSISCAGAGNCVAVGSYADTTKTGQGMMLSQSGGDWGQATELSLPANATTTTGNLSGTLSAVSCTGVGGCDAVGSYLDNSGDTAGLVVHESSGAWGQATELSFPANAQTSPAGEYPYGLACASAGHCVLGGDYEIVGDSFVPMVESSVPPLSAAAAELPAGLVGASYSAQLQATGGTGSYTWSVTSGSLPRGLHLNAQTGAISGTPSKLGARNLTVSVSDSGPPTQSLQETLSLTITGAVVAHARISRKHHSARFTIRLVGPASGLQCALVRVSRGKRHRRVRPHYHGCGTSKRYLGLKAGRYVFYVRAILGGQVQPAPAVYRFKLA